MKAYRHQDGSIWSFRPEENAARKVRSSQRLALPKLPVDWLRAGRRRYGHRRPALGARPGGGEEPLHAPVHDRHRELPRCPPRPARHLHGDREPGRRLLQGRYQADDPPVHRPTTPAPVAAAWAPRRPAATTPATRSRSRRRPARAATRWSSSTPRRARTSRSCGGMNLYFVHSTAPSSPPRRHDPRGDHARSTHRPGRQDGPPDGGAQVLDRRVARRRHQRRHHRDLRVWHRRRRHPGRHD